jgi:DNA-binding transcriptional LysR family regulator
MELQYLSVFYEVAKRGSISGAARTLRIAQPSISRTIQNLESSLDMKLFTRQARGVALTEEGQRVYERCHKIFRECEAIKQSSGNGEVNLRIAASENLCIHVFPSLLPKQALASFELLSATAEEVIKAVVNGEADVGYCYHPAKTPGLSCQLIATVEFVLVSGKKGTSSKPSLRDLKGQSFIGSISRNYLGPFAAKSLLQEAGLSTSELKYQCNSQEAQLAMVEAGLGYSLVPWFVADAGIKRGRIVRIPTARKLKTPLYKITKMNTLSPVLEEFEEDLKRAVEAGGQR